MLFLRDIGVSRKKKQIGKLMRETGKLKLKILIEQHDMGEKSEKPTHNVCEIVQLTVMYPLNKR